MCNYFLNRFKKKIFAPFSRKMTSKFTICCYNVAVLQNLGSNYKFLYKLELLDY